MTSALLLAAMPALAQPFTLTVKKDQMFGSSEGTLVVGVDAVEYETSESDDARHWTYDDIKQIQILSPTRITVKTYEDQGWIKIGADRTFDFEITEGSASSDLVAFLWRRLTVPMVSAIIPPVDETPQLSVPVKLRQRLRGSDGGLHLYEDRLLYVTDHVEHGRAWRFVDVRMVYQPARYRLTVDAYEGGGSATRAFSFELKQPLPAGFLESVWQRLHSPSLARVGTREPSR